MRRKLRYILVGGLSGLAASAALVLGETVFVPLHQRGVAQPVLGIVNSICAMLQLLPSRLLGHKSLVMGKTPASMTPSTMASVAGIAVAFAVYAVLGVIIYRICQALFMGGRASPSPCAARPEPLPAESNVATNDCQPSPSRRRLLIRSAQLAFVSAVGVGAYSLFIRPRWLRIDRVSITLRDLPPELDGLRIAQLTDIHMGPWMSRGQLDAIVDRTNELESDLVVLTGDYVSQPRYAPAYVAQVADAMARLRPRLGTFAVRGNHDYFDGGHATRRELARVGIRLIEDTRIFATPQRTLAQQADRGLCIAGVGDLWFAHQDYDRALGSISANIPRILLSHNPDVAEDPAFLACPHRVDLILSGHTHGGQVRLGPIHALYMATRYGTKYAHGLVQSRRCPVYISAGTGVAVLPVRFNVPPEISLLELRSPSVSSQR